jgi:hypothetical protein
VGNSMVVERRYMQRLYSILNGTEPSARAIKFISSGF